MKTTILRIALVFTMIVSSVGITVVNVGCIKAASQMHSCPRCKGEQTHSAKKSCCTLSAKHFSLKANYAGPAEFKVVIEQLNLLQVTAHAPILQCALPALQNYVSSSPDCFSRDSCALNSTFRI